MIKSIFLHPALYWTNHTGSDTNLHCSRKLSSRYLQSSEILFMDRLRGKYKKKLWLHAVKRHDQKKLAQIHKIIICWTPMRYSSTCTSHRYLKPFQLLLQHRRHKKKNSNTYKNILQGYFSSHSTKHWFLTITKNQVLTLYFTHTGVHFIRLLNIIFRFCGVFMKCKQNTIQYQLLNQ